MMILRECLWRECNCREGVHVSTKFTVLKILAVGFVLSTWTLTSLGASWNMTGSMGSSRIDFSTALLGDG